MIPDWQPVIEAYTALTEGLEMMGALCDGAPRCPLAWDPEAARDRRYQDWYHIQWCRLYHDAEDAVCSARRVLCAARHTLLEA